MYSLNEGTCPSSYLVNKVTFHLSAVSMNYSEEAAEQYSQP